MIIFLKSYMVMFNCCCIIVLRYDGHCPPDSGIPLWGERRYAPRPSLAHDWWHQGRTGQLHHRESTQRHCGSSPHAIWRGECVAQICRTSHDQNIWTDRSGARYWPGELFGTVRSLYNTVKFLQNVNHIHSIAYPLKWNMVVFSESKYGSISDLCLCFAVCNIVL